MASSDVLRPAGVPQAATFIEHEREWAYGPYDAESHRHGSWRFYSESGALKRIAAYERGILNGLCRRYADDQIAEELHYVNGAVDGPYWRRVAPGTYRCEGAAFEVGTFDRGVRVGTVRLLDAGEQEMARFELGRSSVDDEILKVGVLSIFPRSMTAWLELAERAFGEGRVEEGLASLARAVAKGADHTLLERALHRFTLPTSRDEAERRARVAALDASPRILLGALVAGADPVEILRRLSAVLAGSVALDMIEAAIAIARDPVPLLFARGLLRVLSGNVIGARHDARTLRYVRPSEFELLMEAISAIDGESGVRVAS